MEMADLETIQDEVFEKLQLLDESQLAECCVQLDIVVPPAKKGKKSAIKTLILKHLTSDAVEQNENVEDIFSTLNGRMKDMLETEETKEEEEVKPDGKVDNGGALAKTGAGDTGAAWLHPGSQVPPL